MKPAGDSFHIKKSLFSCSKCSFPHDFSQNCPHFDPTSNPSPICCGEWCGLWYGESVLWCGNAGSCEACGMVGGMVCGVCGGVL